MKRCLDEHIAAFYQTEATMLKLIRVFSFIAIFIGCLDLYGLVAFMVAQKTKEIRIIVLVVGFTVGYQSLKAAFSNPVKSLRTE
jgi:putative ABC transport system permease protein